MDIGKLAETLAAATPGPWYKVGPDVKHAVNGIGFQLADCGTSANAAMIAMTPDLAAEVLRLSALVAELTAANIALVVRLDAARVVIAEIAHQPDYRVPSPQDLARAYTNGTDGV